MSEVTYSKKNDEIECVRYEKSRKIYLPHTHSNHLTIGYIEEGQVCITIDGESCIYTQGEEFRIMPNVLHEVKPADDTQVSPYHMIRKFKKAFGLTPHQFQIQCKVRKAQKLLETTKSIPEVAYEAGFCDQSHLDRCFQKIVGMTPRQYQDALINND